MTALWALLAKVFTSGPGLMDPYNDVARLRRELRAERRKQAGLRLKLAKIHARRAALRSDTDE